MTDIFLTPAQRDFIIHLTGINGLGPVTDHNRITALNKQQASDMIKLVQEYGRLVVQYNRGNTKLWADKEKAYDKIIAGIGYLKKEEPAK